MTSTVLLPGGRTSLPPKTSVLRKGYSANRRDYDRRRRLNTHSELDAAFWAIVGQDPCAFCGAHPADEGKVSDVDHIVPLLSGGEDSHTNFTAACRRCNRGRKNTSLLHYLIGRS